MVLSGRISLRKLLALVALLALLLALCIVPIGRHMEWSRLEQDADSSIRNLKPTLPNSLDPNVWNCAHGWVVTAYVNICIRDSTSTDEMYRLRHDLEQKFKDRIDLGTLDWIWNRLGETCPYGKRYIERFRPLFVECFPPGSPPASER